MRGHIDPESDLFSSFSVEERISRHHSLRQIKSQADAVLSSMNAQQVVRSTGHVCSELCLRRARKAVLAQSGGGLNPAEDLFGPFALTPAYRIALMPCSAPAQPWGVALVNAGNMRRRFALPEERHETLRVTALQHERTSHGEP
jgi:hypothetical protein